MMAYHHHFYQHTMVKQLLLSLFFFLLIGMQRQATSLHYEVQFENEHVCVAKVTVAPYEEVGAYIETFILTW
jgi:hypothetical protein